MLFCSWVFSIKYVMVVPVSFCHLCCIKRVWGKGGRFWLKTKLSIFPGLLVASYHAGSQIQCMLLGIYLHLNAINRGRTTLRDLLRTTCALGGWGLYFRVHYMKDWKCSPLSPAACPMASTSQFSLDPTELFRCRTALEDIDWRWGTHVAFAGGFRVLLPGLLHLRSWEVHYE